MGKSIAYLLRRKNLLTNKLSSVGSLCRGICPSAISRFVVSVRINAVNTVLRSGLTTHVFKKTFKRVSPSLTDAYSPASIVFVLFVVWVSASLQHRSPAIVFGASPTFVGVAMCDHSCNRYLSAKAPATFGFSAAKLRGHDDFFRSTIANAIPCGLLSDVCSSIDCSEPSKSLAIQRNNIFSAVHRSFARHLLLPQYCKNVLATPFNRKAISGVCQYAT